MRKAYGPTGTSYTYETGQFITDVNKHGHADNVTVHYDDSTTDGQELIGLKPRQIKHFYEHADSVRYDEPKYHMTIYAGKNKAPSATKFLDDLIAEFN